MLNIFLLKKKGFTAEEISKAIESTETVTQSFLEVIERYGKRLEEHIYYSDTIKTVFRYKVYDEEYLVVKENGKCLEIINVKELTGNARLTRESGNIFC